MNKVPSASLAGPDRVSTGSRLQDVDSLLFSEVVEVQHCLVSCGHLAGGNLQHVTQDWRGAHQQHAVRGQLQPALQLQQHVHSCLELR
jgi:hypothetical protein